jgi:hypothetical protein
MHQVFKSQVHQGYNSCNKHGCDHHQDGAALKLLPGWPGHLVHKFLVGFLQIHYDFFHNLSFSHGRSDSNARHLVLETSALPTELHPCQLYRQIHCSQTGRIYLMAVFLFQYSCYLAGTNSSATLADSKTQSLIDGNRINQ